ncbi:MAG: hypothetical protein J6T23_06060 [Elusimicrobia bacterium]|nr:hypothetical protein [Elusimicrobiota bacterium]
MREEEKEAIEYLKARLNGNEGCELIDVAQSDLRLIIKLVDRVLKADKNWQEIYDEQEENIREKNNKICEFEFIIEKLQKELEQEKARNEKLQYKIDEKELIIDGMKEDRRIAIEEIREEYYISKDKIKEKIEEIKNYTYTSKEERQCQNYTIDRLKELMEVDNK